MRQCLYLLIAFAFLIGEGVAPQPAVSKTLLEKLFPEATKRRKIRKERERLARERQLRALNRKKLAGSTAKAPRVKGAVYKKYTAKPLKNITFNQLTRAFSAYDQKLLAAHALHRVSTGETGAQSSGAHSNGVQVSSLQAPASEEIENASQRGVKSQESEVPAHEQTLVPQLEVRQLPSLRLSAGHELLPSMSLKARAAIGKALLAHYKEHPEFLWINENGTPNEKAQAVQDILSKAHEFGLETQDYQVDFLDVVEMSESDLLADLEDEVQNDDTININEQGVDQTHDDATALRMAMRFEFALTARILRYVSDARNGVVNPNKISDYHDFSNIDTDYKKVMKELVAASDVQAFLLAAHPKDRAFQVLKEALAEVRAQAEESDILPIAPGTFIRPGKQHDQLANVIANIRRKLPPELLERHQAALASNDQSDDQNGLYHPGLVALVKDFQRSQKLHPDGIVGKKTLARLVVDDPAVKVQKIKFAMERLRWHPDSLGQRRVFINQPAYKATYIDGGEPVFSMRTVVGKPANQTYFFHDKIEYVEFNPYWGVPRSILVNEMLPKLRQNPAYFDIHGYEVRNTKGRRIASSSVDWHAVGANFPYNVRQLPGAKNALGELKIMFPNSHSIYMHDTPAKSLFKRSKRAFSHGCVRLNDPRKMAAAVLGTSIDSVSQKVSRGKNTRQKLKKHIPVYVAYFTAWPRTEVQKIQHEGAEQENIGERVEYFDDVYGRDKALKSAFEKEAAQREKGRVF